MGNENGFESTLTAQGTNEVFKIDKKSYFSFAFGNEMALCTDGKYFILNGDIELKELVEEKLKVTKKINEIKEWWKVQSEKFEINTWSGNFEDI